MSKIRSLSQLKKIRAGFKNAGKTVVALSGSFDILHYGHIQYLQKAKAQGDVLIVLLNSDDSVRLYKGPGRPINPFHKRAAVLAALACVDYVVAFHAVTPLKEIELLKPDIYCNAADWGKGFIETETVLSYGGKIKLLPLSKGDSTTEFIRAIKEKEQGVHAIFLDRDGTINDNGKGYSIKKEDFKLLPGVITGLRKLSKKGEYKLIVVTNQSGIGRGLFTEQELAHLHEHMHGLLTKHGITLHDIFYCPHNIDDECDCRKPQVGMILKAAKKYNFNLSKSWMIGDSSADVLMGRMANVKTIKLGGRMKGLIQPNYYVHSMTEAVKIILSGPTGQ